MAAVAALFYAMDTIFGDDVQSFLLASVVGGAIVLLASRQLLKLVIPLLMWLATMVGCLFSGAYIFLVLKELSDYRFLTFASMTGFILWHGMLVLLLFNCSRRNGTGTDGETILQPFVRWLDGKIGKKIECILECLNPIIHITCGPAWPKCPESADC